MDSDIFALITALGIGFFFILVIFILPKRKMSDEEGKKVLHEERCSANWRFKGGIGAGGNIPVARVSFYETFFVVALLKPTKVFYSEIASITAKEGWMSSSIAVHFVNGTTLFIYPGNFDKVRAILEKRVEKK